MRSFRWLLLGLPLCSACYTYAPAELTTIPDGTLVRARISGEQADRVQPLIGRDLRVLEGVLLSRSADSVLLQVPSAARPVTGGGVEVLHQRLSFPLRGVNEVELKKLNRTRTALFIAGGTAVLGYILLDALNIGPGKEGPPGNGENPELRIPLLILRR